MEIEKIVVWKNNHALLRCNKCFQEYDTFYPLLFIFDKEKVAQKKNT